MIHLNTTSTLTSFPTLPSAPKSTQITAEAEAILKMMKELGVGGVEKAEVETMLEVWSRFFKFEVPHPSEEERPEFFNADDFIRALDSKDEQSVHYRDYKMMIHSLEVVNENLHGHFSTLLANGFGLRAALWVFKRYMDWKYWHSGFGSVTPEEYAIAWKVLPKFADATLKSEGEAIIPKARHKLLALVNNLGHHHEKARLTAYKEMMLYLQQPEVKEHLVFLRPFMSQVLCDSLGL